MGYCSDLVNGKTPRSIEISRAENRILRIPDATMMVKQQESLHGMLKDIYQVRKRRRRRRGESSSSSG